MGFAGIGKGRPDFRGGVAGSVTVNSGLVPGGYDGGTKVRGDADCCAPTSRRSRMACLRSCAVSGPGVTGSLDAARLAPGFAAGLGAGLTATFLAAVAAVVLAAVAAVVLAAVAAVVLAAG